VGRQEGWLAEHMVILGIEDPKGNVTYVTAALPSACGKTNLAMMESALPGYKIWTIGDDIAWLNVGPDGRLWAINPETGLFGVAPGTSMQTNPNMMRTLKKGAFYPTLFTNTGLDLDTNEPWWEGIGTPPPRSALDWQGEHWEPSFSTKAAHPNSRFTVSIYNAPTLSKEFDNPRGVPISAMIFGGKRTQLIPLVFESLNWRNGVFAAARMGSETTAAAAHQEGVLRRDPMAMLPFCGYNMGDYFGHWFRMSDKLKDPPKIFSVNWFRTDEEGKFVWPGFGENIRVLKWVIDRVNNRVEARKTPIGLVPHIKDLDLSGLNIKKEKLEKIFEVNIKDWGKEVKDVRQFLEKFGDSMPGEMWQEYEALARQIPPEM
jgi:phosphoenolpyruvate carboxykinase (GTP)